MIRRLLIWFAAADPEILDRCPSERTRYECTGAAVLVTSALAAVSGTFALSTAMRVPVGVAMVFGFFWGLAVMSIDRLLIAGVSRRPTARGNLLAALPRLGLALLVGAVISTPLVLRIFQDEINAQLEINHRTAQEQFARDLAADPRFAPIPTLTERIRELQKIVNTSGASVESDPEVTRLQRAFDEADKAYQAADKEVICEKEGTCGSKKSGAGPVHKEKVARRNRLLSEREEKRSALEAARAQAQQRLNTDLSNSRKSAEQELGTARQDLDRLTAQKRSEEATYAARVKQDSGLLARIGALDDLRARDTTLGWAYLMLMLLISSLEMLPVTAKLLVFLGPVTAYERIREMVEENAVRVVEVTSQESTDVARAESQARLDAEVRAAGEKAARETRVHLELHDRLLGYWRTEQLSLIEASPESFVVTRSAAPPQGVGAPPRHAVSARTPQAVGAPAGQTNGYPAAGGLGHGPGTGTGSAGTGPNFGPATPGQPSPDDPDDPIT